MFICSCVYVEYVEFSYILTYPSLSMNDAIAVLSSKRCWTYSRQINTSKYMKCRESETLIKPNLDDFAFIFLRMQSIIFAINYTSVSIHSSVSNILSYSNNPHQLCQETRNFKKGFLANVIVFKWICVIILPSRDKVGNVGNYFSLCEMDL